MFLPNVERMYSEISSKSQPISSKLGDEWCDSLDILNTEFSDCKLDGDW